MKGRPVTLDISKTSCNQYQYEKCGRSETFTAYQGFKFEKVIGGGKVLWNASGGKFAKKLTVTRSGSDITVSNVVLVGNDKFV